MKLFSGLRVEKEGSVEDSPLPSATISSVTLRSDLLA